MLVLLIPGFWVILRTATCFVPLLAMVCSVNFLATGWIFQCLSPSFIQLGFLTFTSLRSVTVGSGRVGVGLLGLLEPVDPEPVAAEVVAASHVDVATEEGQVVRAVAGPGVST